MSYYELTGSVDSKYIDTDAVILLEIGGVYYETYQRNENEYMMYVKMDDFDPAEDALHVYVVNGEECREVLTYNE